MLKTNYTYEEIIEFFDYCLGHNSYAIMDKHLEDVKNTFSFYNTYRETLDAVYKNEWTTIYEMVFRNIKSRI